MRTASRYKGRIEVVAYYNDGELSIGTYRQRLLEDARGDYVCFLDDDDEVPPYYCKEILDNLGEDYVGFRVQAFSDGVELRPAIHNLAYPNWHEDDNGFYRDITHLNPIRREIALKAGFRDEGAGEDTSYSARAKPFTMTQKYIDKVMYFYRHSSTKTSFGGREEDKPLPVKVRPAFNYKNFRYYVEET